MKLRTCLQSLVILLVSQTALAQGGVGAGSGKGYIAKSGFMVKLDSTLNLSDSQDELRINNLGAAPKVSNAVFRVLSGRVAPSEFERWVARRKPGRKFEPMPDLAGAVGFASERRTEQRLQGEYYLLTNSGLLIEAEIDAYADGRGIELIAPIVRTFAYDDEAPKLIEFKLDEELVAGKTARLKFKAIDTISKIGERPPSWSFLSPKGFSAGVIEIFAPVYPVPGEKDWYFVDFEISKYQASGIYELRDFGVFDRAGNLTTLRAARNVPPITQTRIVNTEHLDDGRSPTIQDLRVPESIRAGEEAEVLVQARDDGSGIALTPPGTKVRLGYTWGGTPEGKIVSFYPEGTIAPAQDPDLARQGWYSLRFQVSRHEGGGFYHHWSIELKDAAGNRGERTFVGEFRGTRGTVRIIPSREEDLVTPRLKDVRVEGPWKTGSTNRLYLRVEETGSGLDLEKVSGSIRVLGYGHPGSGIIVFRGGARAEPARGRDWYSVPVEVNEFVPPGTWELWYLDIKDQVGNWQINHADGNHYREQWGRKDNGVKRLTFRIERR